jgi:hypothetical protein
MIDFTPDNTMDGDKDYATVYVKTEEGLKEFKVSVPETRWGKAEFSYTDKVPYQHKVYEFTIPIEELGIDEIKKETELQLAFSAYGTAAHGNYAPAIAYDLVNNRYLVVYHKIDISSENYDIYGQLLNADGTAYGSEFPISTATGGQTGASVAYDSVNGRFLVVWRDHRNQDTTDIDIYGQLVNVDGTLYGATSNINFAISTAPDYQYHAFVAYDSVNGRFLVVWRDLRNRDTTDADIYGQLVNVDGTLYGADSNTNFPISTADYEQLYPSVAYDSENGRFLVVWEDFRNTGITSIDIYGQLVNANGSLNGSNLPIFTASHAQSAPSVAYDNENGRFLVAWGDWRSATITGADIFGQLVNANGSLHGSYFPISTALDVGRFSQHRHNKH